MNWNQILLWAAPLIAVGAVVIGIAAIMLPAKASKAFGLETQDEKTKAYVRALGARDIFIGLVIFVLYWHNEQKLLGWTCLFTTIVAATDFYITNTKGSRLLSLAHLSGVVLFAIYGIALIRL